LEDHLIEEERRFMRNPDFIFRKVADEIVLVPIHQDVADMDSIYTLNELGAFVWEQLGQPTSIAALQNAILDEYEADPSLVSVELQDFLHQLVEFGAVSRS